MPVTRERVIAELRPDELSYEEAARRLGPEAIPLLLELAQSDDIELASKATALAGVLSSDRSVEVLSAAAHSKYPVVRVAAAASLRGLPDVPTDLVEFLLGDTDAGVRRLTLKSIEAVRPIGVKNQVRAMSESDPEDGVRDLARQIEGQLP